MRLEDLAIRLVAVEAKLSRLTGVVSNGDAPMDLENLDARLTVVETTVDHLIAEKTQEHVDAIISAPADAAPVSVEDVVALSPSADYPVSADIVADVVTAQIEADTVDHPDVVAVVAAAVNAVITAEPDVVADPDAITAAITAAVAEVPVPAPEVAQQAADAVADVIATATGVNEVDTEVVQQVVDAIATPADPALDAIEARLDVAEAKVDGLLGK
jgi:hypothetical protein